MSYSKTIKKTFSIRNHTVTGDPLAKTHDIYFGRRLFWQMSKIEDSLTSSEESLLKSRSVPIMKTLLATPGSS